MSFRLDNIKQLFASASTRIDALDSCLPAHQTAGVLFCRDMQLWKSSALRNAGIGTPVAGTNALACYQQLYALYFSEQDYNFGPFQLYHNWWKNLQPTSYLRGQNYGFCIDFPFDATSSGVQGGLSRSTCKPRQWPSRCTQRWTDLSGAVNDWYGKWKNLEQFIVHICLESYLSIKKLRL